MIVDSDAHVIESEATWDFITDEDLANAPVVVSANDRLGKERDYWIIDGPARNRTGAGNTGAMFPQGARELVAEHSRLRHMDQLGLGVHLVYPCILRPIPG